MAEIHPESSLTTETFPHFPHLKDKFKNAAFFKGIMHEHMYVLHL